MQRERPIWEGFLEELEKGRGYRRGPTGCRCSRKDLKWGVWPVLRKRKPRRLAAGGRGWKGRAGFLWDLRRARVGVTMTQISTVTPGRASSSLPYVNFTFHSTPSGELCRFPFYS